MQAVILPTDQFQELVSQISEIKLLLQSAKAKADDELLDNEQFISVMGISRRTAQNWRNTGKISFSQINGKIYYRWRDVHTFLDANYVTGFASNKKVNSIRHGRS